MRIKHLTLTVAALILSVMTASGVTITSNVLVDQAYSASNDPLTDPALQVAGTWDLTSGTGTFTVPGLTHWSLVLTTSTETVGENITLHVLHVEGLHLEGVPAQTFSASLGMPNQMGPGGGLPSGTITSTMKHGDEWDHWYFYAGIDPLGTMNYEVRAAHEGEAVPDAGAMLAMIALSCGCLGWLGLRKK